jgi:hypothetical protein
MFRAKAVSDVSVVLQEATTAFEQCLQALKGGTAEPVRRPRKETTLTAKAVDL